MSLNTSLKYSFYLSLKNMLYYTFQFSNVIYAYNVAWKQNNMNEVQAKWQCATILSFLKWKWTYMHIGHNPIFVFKLRSNKWLICTYIIKASFPYTSCGNVNDTKTTHSWQHLYVQMKPPLNDEFTPTYWNSAIFYT
jgi:hypothetical protein